MSNDKSLLIRISGDASSLKKEFDSIRSQTQGLENGLNSIAKTSAVAFAGLTASLVGVVAAYREDEQAAIRTQATLKATGYAAGLTAQEVFNLSNALQDVTTFEDSTITSAQNLLLTFKNISRDIFPQATEAALNMATAMGTDASSAAIQLGKALNDPTQGVNALRRVGVSFSESQLAVIKSMQDTGNIAGAQAVILKELESEFGGVARAAAEGTGAIVQLKNVLGNIFSAIGENVFKTIEPFVIKLRDIAIAIRDGNPEIFKLISNVLLFGTAITGVIATLATLGGSLFVVRAGLAALGISFSATWAAATLGLSLLIPLIYSGVQAMGGFEAVASKVQAGYQFLVNNLEIGFNNIKVAIGEVIAKTYELAAATLEAIPSDAFKPRIAEFRAMADALKQGSDELIAKNAELSESYASILEGVTAEKAAAKEKEKGEAVYAEREAAFQAELEQKAAQEEARKGLEAQQREVRLQERAAAFEIDQQIQAAEKELIQAGVDKASEVEKVKLQQKLDALKKARDKSLSDEQKTFFANQDAIRAAEQKDMEQRRQFQQKFADDTISAAVNLGSRLLKEGSAAQKALFLVEKARALASAVVNTATAVTMALSSAPPPASFALAAVTAVAGAIQVASIVATAFGAQDGALVGGLNSRRSGDRVPFMLEEGELVVPKRNFEEVMDATARSRGFVNPNDAGGNGGAVTVHLDLSENAAQFITARQFENSTLGTDRR